MPEHKTRIVDYKSKSAETWHLSRYLSEIILYDSTTEYEYTIYNIQSHIAEVWTELKCHHYYF